MRNLYCHEKKLISELLPDGTYPGLILPSRCHYAPPKSQKRQDSYKEWVINQGYSLGLLDDEDSHFSSDNEVCSTSPGFADGFETELILVANPVLNRLVFLYILDVFPTLHQSISRYASIARFQILNARKELNGKFAELMKTDWCVGGGKKRRIAPPVYLNIYLLKEVLCFYVGLADLQRQNLSITSFLQTSDCSIEIMQDEFEIVAASGWISGVR